ncbi:MAG: glycosyltransferase family 39 protein [Chloroflexi bacterium]|nr:glycosyltransferase family 39 protein [Chloroflexota bacterium]
MITSDRPLPADNRAPNAAPPRDGGVAIAAPRSPTPPLGVSLADATHSTVPLRGLTPSPPRSRTISRSGLLVLLFTFGAFALRALTLTQQSLWLDEVDALAFAARPVPDLLAMMAQPAQNGPLYYLLLKAWTALVGTSEFGLRSLSLLAGVAAIPLIARVGRQLVSPTVGVWGALLAACSPYLFWYGQDGKMYALYLTLTLASMTLFLDGLAHGGKARWIGWLAVSVVGVYVHLYFGLLPLAQHGMAALILLRGERPPGWRGWYAIQTPALVALLPVALWAAPALMAGYRTAFEPVPLDVMLRVLLLRFSLHTEVWPPPWVSAPFALALIAALWTAAIEWRSGRGSGTALLLVWLLVPVLAAALAMSRAPVFLHRYFMMIAPAYLLLLACGVTALTTGPRLAPLGWLCGAGLATASLAALVNPAETRTDFRAAAAYVAARALPGDQAVFVAAYAERAFRYYLPTGRLPGGGAPYANNGRTPAEAADTLDGMTGPAAGRVWLIEHEEWLWDASGLTARRLSNRGHIVEAALFPGVRVTAFAPGPVSADASR